MAVIKQETAVECDAATEAARLGPPSDPLDGG